MKKKTLYILLAVWIVALATLITVCVTAFGDKDNIDGGSVAPPSVEQGGGDGNNSSDSGNNNDDDNGGGSSDNDENSWTGNY